MHSRYAHKILPALLFAVALKCPAQVTGLTFATKGPADAAPVAVGVGGTITFPSTSAGATTTVQLIVTNSSTTSFNVTNVTTTGVFSVTPVSVIPSLGSASLTMSFSPQASGAAGGSLTLVFANSVSVSFVLSGTGIAPTLVTSYIMSPDSNQTTVGDQGTIAYPATVVGQSTVAIFVVTNRGTGPGTISSAVVTGSAFKITGLSLLPADIAAGNEFRFNVVFAPASRDTQTGTLKVTLQGKILSFGLQGQGTGASFTYDVIDSFGHTATVLANGTISLPDTNLGASSAVSLRVTNAGNSTGQVASVTAIGAAFSVSNLAPLPISLTPGGTLVFTLTFKPDDVGTRTGQLLIDSAQFSLQGGALGAKLTFSFRVGSSSTVVTNNGTANFPNTNVGGKTAAVLDILNAGNLTGTISSVNVSGTAFSATLPTLPLSIPAGQSSSIPISFAPDKVGSLAGVLTLDTVIINLQGIGGAPAALPDFTISGVSSTVQPLAQPAVGLTLAQAYANDITGTLTLSFTSDSFVDDPTIQFATGGRTVSFRIPANTTSAVFGSGGNSVQFQSGTVAGTITVTPAFSVGSVNITPTPSKTATAVVQSAPPQITNLQIGTRTTASFEILVTGYSTSRKLSSLALQFTAAAGANLQTTSLNLNVDSTFATWYQSTASVAVGSQFTASVTINVSGTTSAVASVSVTAANSLGSSSTASVSLQ